MFDARSVKLAAAMRMSSSFSLKRLMMYELQLSAEYGQDRQLKHLENVSVLSNVCMCVCVCVCAVVSLLFLFSFCFVSVLSV